MIARQWHGRVRRAKGDAYAAYLDQTGVSDFRRTPGNRGVLVLRHEDSDAVHFTVTSFWDSIEAVKRFAGDDYERARYYPADDDFLLEREPNVHHFDVVVAELHPPK